MEAAEEPCIQTFELCRLPAATHRDAVLATLDRAAPRPSNSYRAVVTGTCGDVSRRRQRRHALAELAERRIAVIAAVCPERETGGGRWITWVRDRDARGGFRGACVGPRAARDGGHGVIRTCVARRRETGAGLSNYSWTDSERRSWDRHAWRRPVSRDRCPGL